jgi:hypothetical protein
MDMAAADIMAALAGIVADLVTPMVIEAISFATVPSSMMGPGPMTTIITIATGPADTITFANDQTSEWTPVRSDAIPSAVGELPSKSGNLQTYRNRTRIKPKYLSIKPA